MLREYEFVTTFPEKHKFAKTLTQSAENNLLSDVNLIVYYEGNTVPENTNKVKYVHWNPSSVKQFISNAKHIQNKMLPEHIVVNSKDYDKKKAWRWHATRFCWKVYAMAEHAEKCSSRYMMWIDSDVEFTSSITKEWLKSLHPEGYYSSYINRPTRHTETGFISFDTHHPYHNKFWKEMKVWYDDLKIFNIKEGWTDCHVYDKVRYTAEAQNVKFFDLVHPQYQNKFEPVWDHTLLINHTRHNKGGKVDKS